MTALPAIGRAPEDVLRDLAAFGVADPDYAHGRVWSLVYYLDEAYAGFLAEAYQAYSSANGLNPTAFKSLKRFESEIIASVAEMLHGSAEVCGVVTSGGTESCLLAVKTYRDLARAKRGVRRPEMVLSETAHVAWFKASEYFGVKVRLVKRDSAFRLDAAKVERRHQGRPRAGREGGRGPEEARGLTAVAGHDPRPSTVADGQLD